MIASKGLYKIVVFGEQFRKIYEVFYDIFLGISVFIIASLTTNYTSILGIYGGGGKLLGGTYIILFYIGMILNKYKVFSSENKVTIALTLLIAGTAWWGVWRLMCNGYQTDIDAKFPLGTGLNR